MVSVSSGVTHSSTSVLPLTPYLMPVPTHWIASLVIPADLSRLQSTRPVSTCHLPWGTVHGPVDLLGRSGQIGGSSAATAALLVAVSMAAMTIVNPRIITPLRARPLWSRG